MKITYAFYIVAVNVIQNICTWIHLLLTLYLVAGKKTQVYKDYI